WLFMTVKQQIKLLFENRRGEYISGEELAQTLNVSRAAIWKAVKSLKDEGYAIAAATNKGYMLSKDSDMLSAEAISSFLEQSDFPLKIEVYKSVVSTNSIAKERASQNEAEGLVILAENQTAGKGRMGRSFYSPASSGIYMSILLRPKPPMVEAIKLTTAAAVAVSRAIEKLSDKKPQIKWVNDIYIGGKKVCGILTEGAVSMESGDLEYAVLGIGINVFDPQDGFPNEIENIANSVFGKKRASLRNELVAETLNQFIKIYSDIGNDDYYNEYKKRSFVIGKEINVIKGKLSDTATVLDIDEGCRLKVRFSDGCEQYLSSGEISIRMPEK
ncbi:MAG: biotin--[acetyl-CoA-carboxylase] ligase, partial [Oscillospiraceae bacterium]